MKHIATDQSVASDSLFKERREQELNRITRANSANATEAVARGELPPAPLPLLGTDLWNVILDCMDKVTEVDRLLLSLEGTGLIPYDAVNSTLTELNILRPSCMKTAHRFKGAEEVNIACLCYDGNDASVYEDCDCDDDHDFIFASVMNEDVLSSILPLLTGLPKLKKAYVGCRDADSSWAQKWTKPITVLSRRFYAFYSCKMPKNHKELFQRLVLEFCRAFRDGALPSNLDLLLFKDMPCCNISRRSGCEICRTVWESFPLDKHLLTGSCCYSFRKRLPLIAARPCGREFLRSKDTLIQLLWRRRVIQNDEYYSGDEDEPPRSTLCIDFREKDLQTFDFLVKEYGCVPQELTREEVIEALGVWKYHGSIYTDVVIRESTCAKLRSLGLESLVEGNGFDVFPDEEFDEHAHVSAHPFALDRLDSSVEGEGEELAEFGVVVEEELEVGAEGDEEVGA